MVLATENFLVIDTEGRNELREIAIIDEWGTLIYEAQNSDHPDYQKARLRLNDCSLEQIVWDVSRFIQGKTLIFHNAIHDLRLLRRSFAHVHVAWTSVKSLCTVKLSQRYFPQLDGYGLDRLSRNLNLKVSGQYFNRSLAHAARYDAAFTYELYQAIMSQMMLHLSSKTSMSAANPFSSSRVDTPFQSHPDRKMIYDTEYQVLKSALLDVQGDSNHQSGGAVVIGEPGSGKTHLMMRLAKDVLSTNRLLFIRQPNNEETILFHIYSRILESLVVPIPGSQYNQLEALVANSIVKFLQEEFSGHKLLEKCEENPTFFFDCMGKEGSETRRRNWDQLIKLIQPWWTRKYSAAGYSWQILRGMLQYCRYTDENRKSVMIRWLAAQRLDADMLELLKVDDWEEDLSRESFSLEAIAVLSKLSLLDEPLILVFDQLEGLGLPQNQRILERFGEAIKEVFTHVSNSLLIFNLFPDRWQQMQSDVFDGSIVDRMSQYVIHLQKPSAEQLKNILQAKLEVSGDKLSNFFNEKELEDILGQASIRSVINRAAAYYRYKTHGVALPDLSIPKVTLQEADRSGYQLLDNRMEMLEKTIRGLVQRMTFLELKVLDKKDVDEETKNVAERLQFVTSLDQKLPEEKNTTPNLDVEAELLMNYLADEREKLERVYDQPTIIDDNDDIGKLMAIASALRKPYRLDLQDLSLSKSKTLPEHLLIQNSRTRHAIGFLHSGGSSFTARIKNFNQLVIYYKHVHFTLIRDAREEAIKKRTVGQVEIEKLQYCANGQFVLLNRSDRIQFDLLYNLLIAIQNKDLEITFAKAIELYRRNQPGYWLLDKIVLAG